MSKARLVDIVKQTESRHNKFIIDKLAKDNNIVILRFPPHHNELNPIEFAWLVIKKHVKMNKKFKHTDIHKLVQDGIQKCTPMMWKNIIEWTTIVEERLWEFDFEVEDIMEKIICSTETKEISI